MPAYPRLSALKLSLAVVLSALGPAPALAAPVRVVASDARGVTVQVSVGAWSLSAPDRDGRVRVLGTYDAHVMGIPGRPMLPAWSALLALPPDARPTVQVIGTAGEQAREGARVVIAGKPVFRDDPDGGLGPQPEVEPVAAIADGPWPEASVQMARPFGFRGRRLLSLEFRPFRYDESLARLTSPLTLTVRVDWNRPAGAAAMRAGAGPPDRNVDASLETSVLNWSQGQDWRVAPGADGSGAGTSLFGRKPFARTGATAYDETQPEVRVKLDETALYRLPFDELVAKGYPAGVAVGEVSVHRHEYLEGANPPYATIELPSEIEDGNGNGTFDSGDAVWLWTRNWAERANPSRIQRYWGDAEVVFVTRKSGGGLRVPQRAGWNNVAALTPLPSFPWSRHLEKDYAGIMPFMGTPNDTNIGIWQWTDNALYYNRPDTIRVVANDIDTTHSINTTVRYVGRKFDSHFIWAAFKNDRNQVTTIVDSVSWFGKAEMVVSSTIRGSALSEGNTNFLRQWGKNQFAPPDPANNAICFAGLDGFDLTYWRRYRAIDDYVRFNSADAFGDVQMQVGGFLSDSLRVYDVTDPAQPVRITLAPAHVTLGATVSFEMQDVVDASGRRQYVAAALQSPPDPAFGPRTPPTSAFSSVTRRDLWAATTGDYLLVAPEAFVPAVARLDSLRRAQGLTVLEAPVETVYDEFNGGRHSAAALQRFARYAYQNWNSRFLLLVGDGTLDPNGVRQNSGLDWIPVLPSPGPVGTSEGYEIIPSDNRYGFITGPEDPITGFSPDPVVPELMVGRLTVNSLAETRTVVNKLVAYEDVQPSDTWRRKVLLNADDAFSGETTFGGGSTTSGYCHRSYEELFVGLNNTMQSDIQSDSGVAGMNVEQFNLRSFLLNERTGFDPLSGDTCRLSREETQSHCHAAVTPVLLGKLNAGQLIWNYQGHANEYVLTHEDMYVNSGTALGDDSQRLANDNKPFLFTAFSCHANMFARPALQLNPSQGPSLGEDLLALPNGRGAVASWASVCFEVVPRNEFSHVNVELMRNLFVHPPRDEFLGGDDRGSRVVLGEVILATLLRYVGSVQSFSTERGLSVSYTLLGDPATRMSIGRPVNRVTANGIPVTDGVALRLHTPGDGLRIDADLVSNVRLDSLALFLDTGAGEAPIPASDYTVTPAFPDTAAGNESGGRHFRLSYLTHPTARSADYIVFVKDRYGLSQREDVALRLDGLLQVGGVPINENDDVSPTAALSLLLLSPQPIANPATDLALTLNGPAGVQPQPFTATPVPSDTSATGVSSRREWVLSWTKPSYPIGSYAVGLAVQGGGSITSHFRVTASAGSLALRDLIPFPNPFDNSGTHFSFTLLGGEDADMKLHVFSQSGRSIYTNVVRGLNPGYHQVAWNGLDAEGDELANGVYFFRLSVTTTSGASTQQLGRLVKLRRPRHVEEPVVP